jgi:hypothetical protein
MKPPEIPAISGIIVHFDDLNHLALAEGELVNTSSIEVT